MRIPKRNGGERPRGIPTVRDRVLQAAARLVREPIFAADFQPGSSGFRPKRDARQAVEERHTSLAWGYPQAGDPSVRFAEGVLGLVRGRAREAPPAERGGNS